MKERIKELLHEQTVGETFTYNYDDYEFNLKIKKVKRYVGSTHSYVDLEIMGIKRNGKTIYPSDVDARTRNWWIKQIKHSHLSFPHPYDNVWVSSVRTNPALSKEVSFEPEKYRKAIQGFLKKKLVFNVGTDYEYYVIIEDVRFLGNSLELDIETNNENIRVYSADHEAKIIAEDISKHYFQKYLSLTKVPVINSMKCTLKLW